MRDAFEEIGYEVLEVQGYGAERRQAVREVREFLEAGGTLEFAYFENSTMPTLLTEPHHLPTHPLVDVDLLRLLRQHRIRSGLFYRDVYWRFPAYVASVGRAIATGTKALYHAELLAYRRWIDRVYLPSLAMAPYVPHIRTEQVDELPPGGRIHDVPEVDGPFTLLYVGNISEYYRMHEFFAAAADVPSVRVIVCTPEDSWAAVRDEYRSLLGSNIEVVHLSGNELLGLFAKADVCALLVEPAEYRDFAAPVKLFEYIGHGKPVLATRSTHAGRVVEQLGAGWTIPYDRTAISEKLAELVSDPADVLRKKQKTRAVRETTTWQARARKVADDLKG
ncbi:glycosyltransferase [Brachybacterium muris]|uniref:glycosyltransferase n=1 Tax=Brachybacterium muris TaxID=219301 RepID=UPI0021A425FF|nr:glycosyltransferase [Brachybacterium muris]MCT1431073.1 glycosyltransferase [Brachybacterium muris]